MRSRSPVMVLALLAVSACQEQHPTTPLTDLDARAFYVVAPTAGLLEWDFENPVTQGSVSSFSGFSRDAAISGSASQTCGGPAHSFSGDLMHLTRFMSPTTCYPYIVITTTERSHLASLTFYHIHNHNPGHPTYGGYDLELQLRQGTSWEQVGPLFRINNANSRTVGSMAVGLELEPGAYQLRWIPRNLLWGEATGTEFLAFNDMVLSGCTFPYAAPVAAAGGPYAVAEGSSVQFDGTGSMDPDGDVLTYAWDLDGDGSFEASGAAPARTYDDDATILVTLRVTDPCGLEGVATAALTVLNVAPQVVGITGGTILSGESWNASGSFVDPGADTWTAVVDYGFGMQPLPLSAKAFALQQTYASAGTYEVVVTVSDDDGGVGSANATVVVLSPLQAVGAIGSAIAGLVASGALSPAAANSLTAFLGAAAQQLVRGNVRAAENHFKASINKVKALERSRRLPPEQARELIGYVERIITSMKK